MMDRRTFLGALGGAAASYDPERALWVPGARRIFIPPLRPKYPAMTREWVDTFCDAYWAWTHVPTPENWERIEALELPYEAKVRAFSLAVRTHRALGIVPAAHNS